MNDIVVKGASALIEAGYSVFPAWNGEAKSPANAHGPIGATDDPEDVKREAWRYHQVAIATGQSSKMVALDADGKAVVAKVEEILGPPTVRTRNGAHWYFKDPGEKTNHVLTNLLEEWGLEGDLRVRGVHQYVLAPPSEGKTWTNGLPDRRSLPPLPEVLRKPQGRAERPSGGPEGKDATAAHAIAERVSELTEGNRHDHVRDLSGYLARHIDEDRALMILEEAWHRADLGDRVEQGEVERAVRDSAEKLGEEGQNVTGGNEVEGRTPGLVGELEKILGLKADPAEFPADSSDSNRYYRTDYGNGQRFADRYGELVRFVPKWHKWLVWNGQRWAEDTGEVTRLAHKTARAIFDEAKNADTTDKQRALSAWAIQSQNRARIEGMLWSAAPYLTLEHTEFDKDPWLLNVENGVLNLRTGELLNHKPEFYITKLAPVYRDPDAGAPAFAAFLEQVIPSDALRKFLQRLVGYALTGTTREHILPFLYGSGSNGKTTFINAILAILGDYAKQSAPDLLLAKHGTHPTELADLFGARFVASTEIEDGRRFAESLVKQLTGGDRIKVRRMREDFWEFEPTHTVFLAANHKPGVRGTDHAIWRRIKLIPFTVTIEKSKQDEALPEKLRGELSGILEWALQGCLDWQANGLGEPDEVTEATAAYRSEMDVLAAFMEDECVVHEDASVVSSKLYSAYKEWCDDTGEKAETQTRFSTRLAERGFDKGRN